MKHGLGRHNYRSPGTGIAVEPPTPPAYALPLTFRGLGFRTISFEPLAYSGWFLI
jgi:hypothetical protein